MKKIIIFGALLLSLSVSSQGVIDAYRYSQTDLLGTARSLGMGGAMGAVGNDISAISINPAGMGMYRGINEILGTLDLNSQHLETQVPNNSLKTDKTYFKFNNLAYVGSFYLGDDAVPFINVGFSYNRIKNFDKEYRADGMSGFSISNVMADKAQGIPTNDLDLATNPIDKWANEPWLALMGLNSNLITAINESTGEYSPLYDQANTIELYNRQKGAINSYDFNIGTEINQLLSLGVSFSVTDLSYSLYSNYYESLDENKYMSLHNYEKTDGTGYQVSVGALLKPSDYLSLGVAYHSPTWYDMRRHISSSLGFNNLSVGSVNSFEGIGDLVYDYNLRTPDRWSFSLATMIKGAGRNLATISADWELTNYSGMKLSENGYSYNDENHDLKKLFKMSSTLRVGAEVAILPNLLARLGYSWKQSGAKDILKNGEVRLMPSETVTQYVLDGDANYFTAGLGYRFANGFFADLAFVYKDQKNKLYTSLDAVPVTLKNNAYQGLLTLGYRFSSY